MGLWWLYGIFMGWGPVQGGFGGRHGVLIGGGAINSPQVKTGGGEIGLLMHTSTTPSRPFQPLRFRTPFLHHPSTLPAIMFGPSRIHHLP